MDKKDWLTKNFEETRTHLKAVAYKMLGSAGDAEDAVQEAWIRLNHSESEKIENLNGWLTTVVARVCLDMLRSRKSRREDTLDHEESKMSLQDPENMEAKFLIADSVGPALLVVLDHLTPSERIAFVLHDLFEVPFEDIAPIIDRTEEATRQLASRARRRIRGASHSQKDLDRQQEVVAAFLAASREGNFEALLRVLHPDAILRADETAIKVAEMNKSRGAPQFKKEIKGAAEVANTLKGKASEARLALVNGLPGLTWAPGGKPIVAFCFSVEAGKISAIDIVMDKNKLTDIEVQIIEAGE
ncbi:RNA polymerase subunit sigma-70 [Bdellovibrio bacteriovorus]|uniref:RNA polymerase subunit sigma-70 n=1 Tax=Bdellovibrio bacteriovorus TaxID=959 RepID=A0A150WW30_BDEBC|nr:sigma-70 family RNA polymerase sigma factor [Bdellovibrio bacteriovorus]KYG70653.1 RNA polymerase subunit sigma-70 [Bdellovibrio bacteriovorus]